MENTEYNICVAGLFNEGIKLGLYSDIIVVKTEKETSKFIMIRFNFYVTNSVEFFKTQLEN